MAFLSRTGTVDSQTYMDAHLSRKPEIQEFVITSAEHFNNLIEEMLEQKTHVSQNSQRSHRTATTNNSDLNAVIAKINCSSRIIAVRSRVCKETSRSHKSTHSRDGSGSQVTGAGNTNCHV